MFCCRSSYESMAIATEKKCPHAAVFFPVVTPVIRKLSKTWLLSNVGLSAKQYPEMNTVPSENQMARSVPINMFDVCSTAVEHINGETEISLRPSSYHLYWRNYHCWQGAGGKNTPGPWGLVSKSARPPKGGLLDIQNSEFLSPEDFKHYIRQDLNAC